MRTLAKHRDEISALVAPNSVIADWDTGNLVVHDGKRGFVVTGLCLDAWSPGKIALAVKEAVQDLTAGLDVDRNGVRFSPLEELSRRTTAMMEVRATVLCNCGRTHPSIDDWQRCSQALTPKPRPFLRLVTGLIRFVAGCKVR